MKEYILLGFVQIMCQIWPLGYKYHDNSVLLEYLEPFHYYPLIHLSRIYIAHTHSLLDITVVHSGLTYQQAIMNRTTFILQENTPSTPKFPQYLEAFLAFLTARTAGPP